MSREHRLARQETDPLPRGINKAREEFDRVLLRDLIKIQRRA